MVGRGWTNVAAAGAFAVGLGLSGAGVAVAEEVDSTWAVDDDGMWFDADNWTDGVPDGVGHVARLKNDTTAHRRISLDQDLTLEALIGTDLSQPYTIESDQPSVQRTLVLDGGEDPARFEIQSRNLILDVDVRLDSALAFFSPLITSSNTTIHGHFDNSAGHAIVLHGPSYPPRGLRLNGPVTWGEGSHVHVTGGTLYLEGQATMGSVAPTVHLDGGIMHTYSDQTFQSLTIDAGDLWTHGADLHVHAPVQLNGGRAAIDGTLGTSLINAGGTLYVSGYTTYIEGDYLVQSDDAELDVILTSAGETRLLVEGDVTLAGTLRLRDRNVGQPGDTFVLVESLGGVIDGTFDTFNEPGGTDWWEVSYTDTTVVVTYIPEPASLALLGLGGLVMLGRRRTATVG